MARRPDPGKKEEIWSRKDLEEIAHNLSLITEHRVRDFYERAYRECRIVNSHTFPPPRAMQEVVQAWKQLRKRVNHDRGYFPIVRIPINEWGPHWCRIVP